MGMPAHPRRRRGGQ